MKPNRTIGALLFLLTSGLTVFSQQNSSTWTSDNGNGTFTNPLFYEEFSDPDLIRVGEDFYMTGTTMHTMPGLPLLHSKDLVNWELVSYAFDRINVGNRFVLADDKEFYGQGIWAPCLRFHNNTFYIFSNINGQGTQVFSATNPAGPWTHRTMNTSLHDLSVLFDDDGKIYAVWGYDEIKMAEFTDDLLNIKPETERVIVARGSGAGEGCHFYKINGLYYITNTNYDPVCYQVCLRAKKPFGPYEINVMSAEENFAIGTGWRLGDTKTGPPFKMSPPIPNHVGCIPMHQGGVVQTLKGEWWGWSMLDYNSIGRVTALSPITWKDGWPHFGLSGNLNRSPRTWVKPNTGFTSSPQAPFERNDSFSGPELKNSWQWNHLPDDSKWSLKERKGYLRLHALPAKSFWFAKNTLTQRAVGPESYATTALEVTNLKEGDAAGLALLNLPYAWIGVVREGKRNLLKFYSQQDQKNITMPMDRKMIWLRAHCNFDTDIGKLSYSFDGITFKDLGDEVIMPFQLKTFQGVRYALFNFNAQGRNGGSADFNNFEVSEPRHKGLTRPIPYNQVIMLQSLADSSILVNWRNHVRPVSPNSKFIEKNASQFRILDRGNGRVALQSLSGGYVTVKGNGGLAEVRVEPEDHEEASTFQWQDMLNGDIMLLSLYSHRYLTIDPRAGSLCSADSPGARPDRRDGSCFRWNVVKE
jgi:xylan 1,4-beta-xylosidase